MEYTKEALTLVDIHSLRNLAREIGVSDASICRWENGVNDITGDSLIALANFFGVTTDYLLGLED